MGRVLDAVEAIEHARECVGRYAHALVAHRDVGLLSGIINRDADVPAGGRVLHCVSKKVFKNLLQPLLIPESLNDSVWPTSFQQRTTVRSPARMSAFE